MHCELVDATVYDRSEVLMMLQHSSCLMAALLELGSLWLSLHLLCWLQKGMIHLGFAPMDLRSGLLLLNLFISRLPWGRSSLVQPALITNCTVENGHWLMPTSVWSPTLQNFHHPHHL